MDSAEVKKEEWVSPEVSPESSPKDPEPKVDVAEGTQASELDILKQAIQSLTERFQEVSLQANASANLSALSTTSDPYRPRESQIQAILGLNQPTPSPLTSANLAQAAGVSGTPPPSRPPVARVPNFDMPKFDSSDLDEWAEGYARWLRLTDQGSAPDQTKIDWVVISCADKKQRKLLSDVSKECTTLKAFITKVRELFPSVETDADLRNQVAALPMLPDKLPPASVQQLLLDLRLLFAKFQKDALSDQDQLLALISKVPQVAWRDLRRLKEDRARTTSFEGLADLLLERARDNIVEEHVESQRRHMLAARGGRSVNMIEEDWSEAPPLPPLPKPDEDPDGSLRKRQRVALLEHLPRRVLLRLTPRGG
mmetsp:Transcript_121709/g.211386  ORF Transcript_121709/g.211386 Transcript_121709/m.211386 type:complete len:368 (-) Transcript_121709:227-1330(-)